MGREYRLSIIVSGQDTGAKTMLGGIGSALGSIGTIAGGILGAGFFLGIANQVKEFAKEAIIATAQVERMQMMLTSLQARELIKSGDFTDMNAALEAAAPLAKLTMDQLERIAIISPYQLENVTNTFRMAQAFGYIAQEATVFTKALLDIGAGVGADNGMLDRMAYNLAQVRMVGKVTALDIRQLAMAGLDLNDVLRYVGDQMGVNIETHEDFNKAIENGDITWEDFTENFGKYADENFGGAAERMSKTMYGLWSSFKDIFALSMPAILGPAFERIGGLLGGLMDNFLNLRDSGALDILGANLANKIEPGIAAISKFLVSVGLLKTEFANERGWDMPTEKFDLGKILDGIDYEAIGAKINEFVLWFAAETKTKFDQTDWTGVFTSFSTALGEFATGLSGQSGSGEGFSITKMLGLDSGQVAEIKATLEPIIASVSNFASVFMTEAMPALAVVGAGIMAAWNTMKPALTELWETFVNQLPSGFNTFSEILPVVAAVIVSGLTLVASVITGIVTGVTMAMQGILAAGEFIRSGISSIFEGIKTYASGFFLVLTGLFTNNADLLKQGWRQTWEGFGEIVSGIFQTVIGVISSGLMASLGLVTGFVGGVIGFFENLYNVLVGHSIIPDMMKAIVLSISGGLALAISNFTTWIASVISVVSGGATAVFNAIMSWVSQIDSAFQVIKMKFYNTFQQAVQQAVNALEAMTGIMMTAISTFITKALSVLKPIFIKIGVDLPNFADLAKKLQDGMDWLNDIKNGKGNKGGKSTNPNNGGGSSGGSGSGNGVPQLASGGIASGPRSGFPAILHGTEAVIPLNGGSVPVSLNPSGMGGGGGIFFTFVYSPVVSTASEYEAGSVIGPIVADVVRNEFAKRNM